MGGKPRKQPDPRCTAVCPLAGQVGKAEECERARCERWPNTYLGPCSCSCHKLSVTVVVMGHFVIEASTEEDYQNQREEMMDNLGDMGFAVGCVESEMTDDDRWFDDEGAQ